MARSGVIFQLGRIIAGFRQTGRKRQAENSVNLVSSHSLSIRKARWVVYKNCVVVGPIANIRTIHLLAHPAQLQQKLAGFTLALNSQLQDLGLSKVGNGLGRTCGYLSEEPFAGMGGTAPSGARGTGWFLLCCS